MLNKNGERALAYIAKITKIEALEGYDRVEYATINDGWKVIISKSDNFKVGDECIYFEIDSKVNNEDPRFAFLLKRDFKIKSMKMCKVISQGLVMPRSLFPELADMQPGDDVTTELKVIYYDPEDNARKNPGASEPKKRSWLYRHVSGHKFLFKIYKKIFKERPSKKSFPINLVSKSDEERIQNMAWVLKDKFPMIVTEKIDGTSTTFIMERKDKHLRVYSRNMLAAEDSVYVAMAKKYNVEKCLKGYLKKNKDVKFVCIQGESFGYKLQGNPYDMTTQEFRAFNFIDSEIGRYPSDIGKDLLARYNIPWVPIIYTDYILPDTVDELIQAATGPSEINKDKLREGWVIRSKNGKNSFKAVSNEYLLKKGN